MKLSDLELAASDREKLQEVVAKGSDWRARHRAQKGLTLYFLPPYSPELNRIEKFWHKVKYELMEFQTRNVKTLEEDVCKILDGFGKDYVMTF